jgi:hypothetical protein
MGAKMKIRNLLVVAAALLGGCQSVEPLRPDISARPVPSRLDEIAYINVLREAYVQAEGPLCYNGSKLKPFKDKFAEGLPRYDEEQETSAGGQCITYRDQPSEEDLHRYLDAGFGLTDLYCQRFFTIAANSAQNRRFQRNAGNTLDALMGTVLTAAKAGTTALGIVNGGFEAVDATYQNIDSSFLVAPEMETVRKLVHAAQADYRARARNDANFPKRYPAARAVLERYAGLCTFTGMRQLVTDSVKGQTSELTAAAAKAGTNTAPPAPLVPGAVPAAVQPAPERSPEARVIIPSG